MAKKVIERQKIKNNKKIKDENESDNSGNIFRDESKKKVVMEVVN